MAHHASAKKRIRQNEKRRLRNRSVMSEMRTAVRKFEEACEAKNKELATELLKTAQSKIARSRKHNIIHKNNMARRISKLALKFNKL